MQRSCSSRYKKQDWQSDTKVKPFATLLSGVLWNFIPYNHTFVHVPTITYISGHIVSEEEIFKDFSQIIPMLNSTPIVAPPYTQGLIVIWTNFTLPEDAST